MSSIREIVYKDSILGGIEYDEEYNAFFGWVDIKEEEDEDIPFFYFNQRSDNENKNLVEKMKFLVQNIDLFMDKIKECFFNKSNPKDSLISKMSKENYFLELKINEIGFENESKFFISFIDKHDWWSGKKKTAELPGLRVNGDLSLPEVFYDYSYMD